MKRKIKIAKKAMICGFCFSLIPILFNIIGGNKEFILSIYAALAIFIGISSVLYIMAILNDKAFDEAFSKEDLKLFEKYRMK